MALNQPNYENPDTEFCISCYEGREKESLITPCKCGGDTRFWHYSCLSRFLAESLDPICGVCGEQYKDSRIRRRPNQMRCFVQQTDEGKFYMIFLAIFWIGFLPFMVMIISYGNAGLGLILSFIIFILFFNCFWIFLFEEEHKKWLQTQHFIIRFSQWAGSNRTLFYDLTETRRLRQQLAAEQREAGLVNEDLHRKYQMIAQQKIDQFEHQKKQSLFVDMDLFNDEDQNPDDGQNLVGYEEHDLALHQVIERWQQQPEQLRRWEQQWQQQQHLIDDEESEEEDSGDDEEFGQWQHDSDNEEDSLSDFDIFDDRSLSDSQEDFYEWFDANYWNPFTERLV